MKKIIPSFILIILMAILVCALSVEYISPIDDFYLIKDIGYGRNTTYFEANATPTGTSGNIINMSFYHNISGTFGVNYTNDTVGTVATETNRIFPSSDTSISLADLSDGLVFIWNIDACDNITKFYNEDVALVSDVYVIYDNYSNTTGDGYCVRNSSCLHAEIITAGRGQVTNYPLSSLDGVFNTTGELLPGACTLNGSTNGYFYCNQTRKNYNGTDGLRSTEALITSSVKVNYTISSSCKFIGANRTVYVEDAPSITLTYPSDSSYTSDGTIPINFTVSGDEDTYLCHVYSNDTGSWTQELGESTATNNTYKLNSKVFTEGNVIWNVRCSETANSNIYGWSPANYTVTVDETDPAITLHSPSDDAYVNYVIGTDGYSATFNLTVIDRNARNCTLKVNGTANVTEDYTSGTHFDFNFSASDGNYEWNVLCRDDATRTTETTNRTITIDTVMPHLHRNINYSSSAANCKGFTVEFNFSEGVNVTFTYGTSSMAQTHSEIEADYSINQTVTLTFNDSYETDYYVNVSIKDRAGNHNNTIPQMTIPSPIPLCTGWSLWSVYDSTINLSDYREASTADFVYYWNNTGQSWIYSASAGSLNEGYEMGIGDVVQLYESTNTTHFRNNSGTPGYHINITGGHVYFGLYHAYSFGNISYVIFLNETGRTGNFSTTPTGIYGAGGLDFNITYLSSFNNSNQQYIDAPYGWGWNNDTTLGKNYKNSLDTLWAFVDYNLSINFTPDGEVLGNWT